MATALPAMFAFAFLEIAKVTATTLLAPDAPEVPDIDLENSGIRRDLQADQAGRTGSRLGSIANSSGLPGGPIRVGQPQVILGPSSNTGGSPNA